MKKTFITNEVSVENAAKIEQSWIQLTGYAVHLGAIYLPPGSDASMYEQVISSTRQVIESSEAADRILVFGDFNCVVEWIPDLEDASLLRVNDGPAANVEFVDSMTALGLTQICNVRSRNQFEFVSTDLDGDFT